MAVTSKLAGPSFSDAPVWKRIVTQTWATGDEHAEQSQTVPINGILQKIILKASSVTGNPTVTLTIDDNGDNEIFTSGAKADGATYTFSVYESISGIMKIAVDPSADPGGSSQTLTVVITLRGVR